MKVKKIITKTIILIFIAISLSQSQEAFAQLSPVPIKEQVSNKYKYRSRQGGLDFSFIHLNYHQAFAISDKLMLGFEGGVGYNFLSFFLAAGDHFATKRTLVPYDGNDQYGNEFYAEFFTLQLFARIRTKEKKDLFDAGFQIAAFLHVDDSSDNFGGGTFKGVYLKKFFMLKNKKTGAQRIGIGVQISAGQYYESESTNQFGIRSNFWVRYYFKRGLGKRNY